MNDQGGLNDPFVSTSIASDVTSLTLTSSIETENEAFHSNRIKREMLEMERRTRKHIPPSKSESCYYEMDEHNMIYTKQGKATIKKAKRSRKQRDDVATRENKLRNWVKELLTTVRNQEKGLAASKNENRELRNRISVLESEKGKMLIDIYMLGAGNVMADWQLTEEGNIQHLSLKEFS